MLYKKKRSKRKIQRMLVVLALKGGVQVGVASGHRVGRSFLLTRLFVHPRMRRRGVGSNLLRLVGKHCAQAGIRRIEVDDMSDWYRSERNIYTLLGFSYRSPHGPEMYVPPKTLLRRGLRLRFTADGS